MDSPKTAYFVNWSTSKISEPILKGGKQSISGFGYDGLFRYTCVATSEYIFPYCHVFATNGITSLLVHKNTKQNNWHIIAKFDQNRLILRTHWEHWTPKLVKYRTRSKTEFGPIYGPWADARTVCRPVRNLFRECTHPGYFISNDAVIEITKEL